MVRVSVLKRDPIDKLLEGDLGFHGADTGHPRHALHAFAAKFPPQLPAWFIEGLTQHGDVVLDPFMGSGTTVLEASILGRKAMGIDIDPLAVLMARTKVASLDPQRIEILGSTVITQATARMTALHRLDAQLASRFSDPKDRDFINYWFLPHTAQELEALIAEIESIEEPQYRQFFLIVFSSIIVTKSGGVSRARDLAHSRPHRVDAKIPRSAIDSFNRRLKKLLQTWAPIAISYPPSIAQEDIRSLSSPDEYVDLIVTSPPYANAIDYVRANKFSLIWMGQSLKDLALLRANYIGTERHKLYDWTAFPGRVQKILSTLDNKDHAKAGLLGQYFADMRSAMVAMFRVLKTGKAAFVVVGTSTMRGIDVNTPHSLASIAETVGFVVRGVIERSLDRDRRMMPARWGRQDSGIEQRIHTEHVIALTKP